MYIYIKHPLRKITKKEEKIKKYTALYREEKKEKKGEKKSPPLLLFTLVLVELLSISFSFHFL